MAPTADQAKRAERMGQGRASWGAPVALALLTVPAGAAGLWKLPAVAWTAFVAMAAGAALGGRTRRAAPSPHRLVWSYGLASGAMVASAAVFLVPPAIGHHAAGGGLGLAVGLVTGFALHTTGHQLTHRPAFSADPVVVELTVHALAAGLIIGLVYATMPALGVLLGLAIVSHKGPAGYAAARRLRRRGGQKRSPATRLLLPAAAVGLAALPVGLLDAHFAWPAAPVFQAVVFGGAAGVFLHVAMDFLPRCRVGGEIHEALGREETDHALLDRLRMHAAFSTAAGALAVVLAWLALGGWG